MSKQYNNSKKHRLKSRKLYSFTFKINLKFKMYQIVK